PVPADSEPVTVGGLNAHLGVQALVDQRVGRLVEDAVEQDRRARIGEPTAHVRRLPGPTGPSSGRSPVGDRASSPAVPGRPGPARHPGPAGPAPPLAGTAAPPRTHSIARNADPRLPGARGPLR